MSKLLRQTWISPTEKKPYRATSDSWTTKRNFISKLAEKLKLFNKLLKTEVPINITSELRKTLESVSKALSNAFEIASKQPIPGKQLVSLKKLQAPEIPVMLSWLRITWTRNYNRNAKRAPQCRLDRKYSQLRNSKYPFTGKIFWQSTWRSLSLQTFYGKQQNRQSFWKITNHSGDSSRRKQFHQRCGMHVTVSCNLISKSHTLPAQSTQQMNLSPEENSKTRRRYVSKSEKKFKQHPLRWQHLPRTSLMKNNSSSLKQTMRMSQKNRPSNKINTLDKMRING